MRQTSDEDLERLRRTFPPAEDALFRKWFPGLKRSGTEVTDGSPRFRVLCWPNAGNAEVRRRETPLERLQTRRELHSSGNVWSDANDIEGA